MISHFLLNLQRVSRAANNHASPSTYGISDQAQISSVRFARSILGSLGGSLRDWPYDVDDEESDSETEYVYNTGDVETSPQTYKNAGETGDHLRAPAQAQSRPWN